MIGKRLSSVSLEGSHVTYFFFPHAFMLDRALNLFRYRPVSNVVRQLKETLVADKEDKDLSHYVSDLVWAAVYQISVQRLVE